MSATTDDLAEYEDVVRQLVDDLKKLQSSSAALSEAAQLLGNAQRSIDLMSQSVTGSVEVAAHTFASGLHESRVAFGQASERLAVVIAQAEQVGIVTAELNGLRKAATSLSASESLILAARQQLAASSVELKKQADAIQGAVQSLEASMDAMNATATTLDGARHEMRVISTAAQQLSASAATAVNQLGAFQTTMQDAFSQMALQYKDLQSRISHLQGEANNSQAQLANLEKRLRSDRPFALLNLLLLIMLTALFVFFLSRVGMLPFQP